MVSSRSDSDTKVPILDAYDTLQVSLDATDDEIKKAYRKLSLKCHPDKNPKSADEFTMLKDAYDILSHVDRKKNYDRFGIDLGEENIESSIWSTNSAIFLIPYGQFVIKFVVASAAAHLISYSYIFSIIHLLVLIAIGYFLQNLAGRQSNDSEGLKDTQIKIFYLAFIEVYFLLSLISQWLTDFYFLFGLVIEFSAPYIFLYKIACAVAVFICLILSCIFSGVWHYVFLVIIIIGILGLLSGILATVLIHVWMDSIELSTKKQVRRHREDMRIIKNKVDPGSVIIIDDMKSTGKTVNK